MNDTLEITTVPEFACGLDGCKHSAKSAGGLGAHRKAKHGIHGKHRNAKRQKASKELVPIEKEMVAQESAMGIASMLEVVFPAGIPPHKIAPVVVWVQATDELLK